MGQHLTSPLWQRKEEEEREQEEEEVEEKLDVDEMEYGRGDYRSRKRRNDCLLLVIIDDIKLF